MTRQHPYRSPYSIYTFIFILFTFAANYERVNNDGSEISWEERRASHLDPFHQWLQGTVETEWPSVFPYAASDEWDENGANANFLEGCLYSMLAAAFPSAMSSVIDGVESYPEGTRDQMFMEIYTAGFLEGDGSISASVLRDSMEIPRMKLAIKGAKIPFKAFLLKNGFSGGDSGKVISRSFAAMNVFWFLASYECLALKRYQFFIVTLLALALRVVGTFIISPLSWFVHRFYGMILSSLNHLHGAYIPEEFYEQHFEKMRTNERKLLLNVCVAGWIGSDGNVGSGRNSSDTSLIQSCYPLLKALSKVLKRSFGFASDPVVYHRPKIGSRWRDSFSILFSVEQAEAMILLVGSFDYNRRAQWLLTLISRLVVNAPAFPNKSNIQDFIQDLLILIRKLELS